MAGTEHRGKSGGWVKVNAENREDYRPADMRIQALLTRFGVGRPDCSKSATRSGTFPQRAEASLAPRQCVSLHAAQMGRESNPPVPLAETSPAHPLRCGPVQNALPPGQPNLEPPLRRCKSEGVKFSGGLPPSASGLSADGFIRREETKCSARLGRSVSK
jgi:hypothetical protein